MVWQRFGARLGRMRPSILLRRRCAAVRNASLAALLTLAGPLTARAAEADDSTLSPAIQMLADVALIDHECRNVGVVFGKAFQASETQGVPVLDVMPGGPLRPSFEAAYRLRFATASHEDLCGSVAARHAAEIPGLFAAP
jgi:hypothetical protein